MKTWHFIFDYNFGEMSRFFMVHCVNTLTSAGTWYGTTRKANKVILANMNEWMIVFILTSDKPQMKLQRMDTKCHSLHNKNYSLQYDLVWVFI